MEISSAVLIAEKVKKDVVYSAECFDAKPLGSNTQLIVEYSVMALEAKYMAPMDPGDTHDVIRKIDGAIDVVKGILNIGSVAFPPAAPVLGFFSGIGSGIQSLMGFIPDNRPNPVVEKYKELEGVIHDLGKTMEVHFEGMQLFLTEHNFNLNIVTQATTLLKFMRNCIKHQEKHDVENFKREYFKNYPLSAVYNMKSLLDNRQTNPLRKAMDAERIKTKATFNKWKNIFTSILGQYLFIEAFARGLLDQSDFNQERIIQQWQVLDENLEKWADEYKKDEKYWEELKNDFPGYFERNAHLSNAQKSKEIRERLNTYLTHDSFYVIVINESTEKDDGFFCSKWSTQMIATWKTGRCDAFVYRSRNGSKLQTKDYERLERDFQDANSLLRWNGNLVNMLRDQLKVKAQFSPYGLFGIIGMQCNAQINAVNGGKEPGRLQRIWLKDQKGNNQGQYWLLIVAQ